MSITHDEAATKFERHYFVPGEVILHLEYIPRIKTEETLSAGGLSAQDRKTVYDVVDRLIGKGAVYPWTELQWIKEYQEAGVDPILHFPRLTSGGYVMALVPLEVRNEDTTQARFVDLLDKIYTLIHATRGGLYLEEDILLRYVTPNWFAGATHHQGSTGGPGSPPRRVAAQISEPVFEFSQAILQSLQSYGVVKKAHVAILDTLPGKGDFLHAESQAWYKGQLQIWLDRLRNSATYVASDPASQIGLERVANFCILKQHYEMPDHGLFVAEIIHAITDKAVLHLYETLNRQGLGTYYTVARSLSKILADIPAGTPLIINCSLVFDYPRGEHDTYGFPFDRDSPLFLHTEYSMGNLFQRLARLPKVLVVAAAGNDGSRQKLEHLNIPKPILKGRLAARYPAAFSRIIGVGALAGEEPASYSNLADEPASSGYLIFGGDLPPGQGLRGVYLGLFPKKARPSHPTDTIEYFDNQSGWADWSGTSFAAAVVSGLLALWWGMHANRSAESAKTFLDTAKTYTLPNTGEKILLVRQL